MNGGLFVALYDEDSLKLYMNVRKYPISKFDV